MYSSFFCQIELQMSEILLCSSKICDKFSFIVCSCLSRDSESEYWNGDKRSSLIPHLMHLISHSISTSIEMKRKKCIKVVLRALSGCQIKLLSRSSSNIVIFICKSRRTGSLKMLIFYSNWHESWKYSTAIFNLTKPNTKTEVIPINVKQ